MQLTLVTYLKNKIICLVSQFLDTLFMKESYIYINKRRFFHTQHYYFYFCLIVKVQHIANILVFIFFNSCEDKNLLTVSNQRVRELLKIFKKRQFITTAM